MRCKHKACALVDDGCLEEVTTTSDQLRAMREAVGLSQGEAARLVGYKSGQPDRTWRRQERGETSVSETAAHLFALLTGQEYPCPPLGE